MTAFGLLVTFVFLASYAAMTITSGMHTTRAKVVQWGCWGAAMLTMFVCYLLGPTASG